jgi:hypothetical protein
MPDGEALVDAVGDESGEVREIGVIGHGTHHIGLARGGVFENERVENRVHVA